MPDQTAQEKTEQPTPKKREEARKKGQVARSMEVNTAFILLAGTLMMLSTGPAMLENFSEFSRGILHNLSSYTITANTLPAYAWIGAKFVFIILAPFWAVMFAVGLVSNFGQVGVRVSEEAFKLKWDRLNIFKGMKELFTRAPFELAKNLAKMLLVAIVAYFVLARHLEEFFFLGDREIQGIIRFVGDVGFELMSKVVMAVIFIAVIDYAYQRYRHTKQLKMTKQEVKEEFKQTEGDPQVKSRVKQLQREMAHSRMMQKVPEADVVITNPTHYAIALKYDQGAMEAPVVLAKGMRKVAERIKDLARKHDIPVVEDPPLTRSIYDLVEVGDEIPTKFYQAIAEILAQIYKMRK